MIKEAIEKIAAMTKPIIQEIEGRTFAINSADNITEVRPVLDKPETLELTSLDALVKLIKTEALGAYEARPLYITLPTHTTVLCFAKPAPELRFERQMLYVTNGTDIPGWGDKVALPFEEAMIALRTRFQGTNDTAYALKLLSEISTGAKITFNDNGIATTVVTKKGIDLQSNEAIRPIITLKPYRTFQEVEQPASQFLIRLSDRGITFVEADGGMWKLEARKTIKAHLEQELADEVRSGDIVVAL